MDEITRILEAIEGGDTEAADELLKMAYQELRQIAAQRMASERAGHTLQPTALVHEAYLRLLGSDGKPVVWNSRGHFFAAASQAMRRILIESARRKLSAKRGGGADHTSLDESELEFAVPSEEILAVDEALKKLEVEDPHLAEIVTMRYFAGMTIPEAASALWVSTSTMDRHWQCAKAWLRREIAEGG